MRVNTIFFDFSELEQPSNLEINIWLKSLGFKNGEILSIQYNRQIKHVLVKLENARLFDDFLIRNSPTTFFKKDGTDYHIPTGGNKSQVKLVTIKYIPLESNLNALISKLGEYGTVGQHQRERLDYTKQDGFAYETELISVQIWLQKDIPSFIRFEEHIANVWYQGQPQTCAKCDSKEHRSRDCPQTRKRRWEDELKEKEAQNKKVDEESKEAEPQVITIEENGESQQNNEGWVSPRRTANAGFLVTAPNALPTITSNRYEFRQTNTNTPIIIPLERQIDPSVQYRAGNRVEKNGKPRAKSGSPRKDRLSRESMDELKRAERKGSIDRKRKETEEKDNESGAEKVQRKGTPEKTGSESEDEHITGGHNTNDIDKTQTGKQSQPNEPHNQSQPQTQAKPGGGIPSSARPPFRSK